MECWIGVTVNLILECKVEIKKGSRGIVDKLLNVFRGFAKNLCFIYEVNFAFPFAEFIKEEMTSLLPELVPGAPVTRQKLTFPPTHPPTLLHISREIILWLAVIGHLYSASAPPLKSTAPRPLSENCLFGSLSQRPTLKICLQVALCVLLLPITALLMQWGTWNSRLFWKT